MKHFFITIVLLALFNSSIKAESWSDAGNYNISWYTADPNIYISSATELAGVAYLVNNNFTDFSNQTIHLKSDIDLSNKNWIPIGHNYTFKGSIDGHGHSITGITINNSNNVQGFIGNMSNGIVRCLTLKGNINTNKTKAGMLVASASGCIFQDLNIISNISYINQTISASTSWNTQIYSGGVVAIASNCTFTDIKSKFEQSLIFGKSGGGSCFGYFYLYAGGIVGYASSTNNYLRCEGISSFNNTVYGYNTSSYYSTTGSTNIYCGGIVGRDSSSSSNFTSCLSRIINSYGSHPTGIYDIVSFYTMGFGYLSGKIKNSVAIVDSYNIVGHNYSWVASWYHTNAYLYDCGEYKPSSIGGCYFNKDVSKTTTKINGDVQKLLSSTSYTKAQINTQSFVDELNFYSRLNMNGEENWEIKEGQIKLKHPQYNYTDIKDVNTYNDQPNETVEYYTLQGIRVQPPLLPGIYVRRQGTKSEKILIN